MEYKRLTGQEWSEDIDLTQELGYSYIYKRLHELENKIERGKLIELPCKVGDNAYLVIRQDENCIIENLCVTQISIDESGIWVHMRDEYLFLHCIHSKSKGLFFTREEAEKRLKELQE